MESTTNRQPFAARMEAVVQRMRCCPFCGGKDCPPANVIVDDVGTADFSEVFCPTCKARGPKADDWEQAAQKWNQRDAWSEALAAKVGEAVGQQRDGYDVLASAAWDDIVEHYKRRDSFR